MSDRQHLPCFILNGKIAIDAGSLAFAVTAAERKAVRDIVLTHSHLDHIAGLPMFIDDQVSILERAVKVWASEQVINAIESHIFNWVIYPKFSEIKNQYGFLMEYREIKPEESFEIEEITFTPLKANHSVDSFGFVISDSKTSFAITGDTATLDDSFWQKVNSLGARNLLIECAFPNKLSKLAEDSYHLIPEILSGQIANFKGDGTV
ncbi:MAG TPA: 3',5'-cyclic-nucleotide phosphodiesterase, partial [Pyrinomonadaceae bacterium]|nr:3',5'-cyclic-nucleotide phosphodiesterase [Pyrinomonadaceae bacterium]